MMKTSVAEYYLDELTGWRDSINFHIEEIDESEERLREVLHFNTIPKLAASTEHFLTLLTLSRQNFFSIKNKITELEAKLEEDGRPIGNELLNDNLKRVQKELRINKHSLEKEYLDVKFSCDEFLADTLNVQLRVN